MAKQENDEIQSFTLDVENELRILVEDEDVYLTLTSGQAEIFGSLMVPNVEYKFPYNSSIAAFSYTGCKIDVKGKCHTVVKTDTHMVLNAILHSYFQERRLKAETDNTLGPTILVVGPTDVGKSTLCRFLMNYAARMGKKPLYVDLDVGQNGVSIPGSLCILTVERPGHIITGYERQAVQVYPFGHVSPGHNIYLYFLLLQKLGITVQAGIRRSNNNTKTSGIIINSCGWVRGRGYQAITQAAMSFEVNYICVLEEERLYLQLKKDTPLSVEVIYLPKIDGVIERTKPIRRNSRDARITEYFYGVHNNIKPFVFTTDFNDLMIFRVDSQKKWSEHDDPSLVSLADIDLKHVKLEGNLVNRIIAVSSSSNIDAEVAVTHVVGFVCVTRVDVNQGTITLLSPHPGPLPHKVLLVGEIRMPRT